MKCKEKGSMLQELSKKVSYIRRLVEEFKVTYDQTLIEEINACLAEIANNQSYLECLIKFPDLLLNLLESVSNTSKNKIEPETSC